MRIDSPRPPRWTIIRVKRAPPPRPGPPRIDHEHRVHWVGSMAGSGLAAQAMARASMTTIASAGGRMAIKLLSMREGSILRLPRRVQLVTLAAHHKMPTF